MKTADQILEAKGHTIWSIAPDSLVYDALTLMADKKVGAVMVLEDGQLVGVFSEREYSRKIILEGKSSKETRVGEIMREIVAWVDPEQSIEECMELMTDKRVRYLPVLEEQKLVGVISIGDVVKAIISEQEFTIGQLERYITS